MHTNTTTNIISSVQPEEGCTMGTMTAKRPSKPEKKKANRDGRAVTLWLRTDLFEALEEWRSRQPVPPVRTAIVEKALVQFLAAQGIAVDEPDAD